MSQENMKGTTRKIISQKGEFLTLFRPLIRKRSNKNRSKFLMLPLHLTNFEIKNIIKMNINPKVFIQK